MAKSPNANPAETSKTGLSRTYACVTMVDVAEGDCYVVDIKQSTDLEEAKSKAWNRYLLDMGAEKNVDARMAAILKSLYNADYNTGTIQEEKDEILLGGPWEDKGNDTTAMPPMSGVFITHSDADHCGNATRVLSDYVNRSGAGASNNCIKDYTLPVFLSPMWQWTLGVIVDTATHIDKYGMLEEFCIIRAKVLTRQVDSQQRLEDVCIEVEHRDTPRSGGVSERQTWRNLKDLAEQAGYRLVYRFNYIGGVYSTPDIAESFSSVQLERLGPYFKEARVEGEKNFSDSPTRRLTRLGKSAATVKKIEEAEKKNKDAMDPVKVENGTAPKFKPSTATDDLKTREADTLLIEVGLQAKSNFLVRRTLSNGTTNNLITGHWLRTAIPIKKIADHGSMEFMQKKAKRGAIDEEKTDEEKKVDEETFSRRLPGEDMTMEKRLKGEARYEKYGADLYENKDNQSPGERRSRPAQMQSYQRFKPSSSRLKAQRILQTETGLKQENALENEILSLSIGEEPMPDFLAVLGVPREHTKVTSSNFEINSDFKYVALRYCKEEEAPEGDDSDEKKDNGDPEDNGKDDDKDKDNDGQGHIDIELGSTHLPIDYHLIGLDDELRRLPFPPSEVKSRMVHSADKSIKKKPDDIGAPSTGGHFSESRFGCAGRTYVRDLVHLTLQHRLPNTEKLEKRHRDSVRKKAEDVMKQTEEVEKHNQNLMNNYKKELEIANAKKGGKKPKVPKLKKLPNSRLSRVSAALKTLGLEPLQSPSLWAEYANRASIITHFVYKENPGDEAVPPKRILGIGNFNMLFTGDAFEAGRNESINTPGRQYAFESNWVPHSVSDFSNHVADGNLLAWLWKQGLFKSLRVDVLKLPHHGSSVTTAFSFFRQVSASVYLISACASIHNHPRAEALKAIVATVLQEDGPARPPSEFSRRGNTNGKCCISKRKRPRLVFMTNAAKFPEDRRWERALKKVYDWCLIQQLWPIKRDKNNKQIKSNVELEFMFNDEVARYIHGDPADAKFDSRFKNEMFGCDWLRDCPNLRVQPTPRSAASQQAGSANDGREKGKKGDIPLANIRFFYQRKPNAATRLRFGRDENRSDEVRVEWHAEDWVEMRYEWDEQDLNVREHDARWYTLDKDKWKLSQEQQGAPKKEKVPDEPDEVYLTYLSILKGDKPLKPLTDKEKEAAKKTYSLYLEQLQDAMRMQDPKFNRPERPIKENQQQQNNASQAVTVPNSQTVPILKPERKSLAELYKNIIDDPLAYPYYEDDKWEIPAESIKTTVG